MAKALGGALPTQEWGTLFTGLASNRHHKRLAWEMMTTHWDALFRVWGQSQFKMKSMIAACMAHADADEVQVFFDSHPCHLEHTQEGFGGINMLSWRCKRTGHTCDDILIYFVTSFVCF